MLTSPFSQHKNSMSWRVRRKIFTFCIYKKNLFLWKWQLCVEVMWLYVIYYYTLPNKHPCFDPFVFHSILHFPHFILASCPNGSKYMYVHVLYIPIPEYFFLSFIFKLYIRHNTHFIQNKRTSSYSLLISHLIQEISFMTFWTFIELRAYVVCDIIVQSFY